MESGMIELAFTVIGLLIAVAIVGGGLFFVSRMQKAGVSFMPGGQQGVASFEHALTSRLGYVSQPDASKDPAADMRAGKTVRSHMQRQVQGRVVDWVSDTQYHGTSTSVMSAWSVELPASARISLQVSSASLGSVSQGAGDFMTSKRRSWSPRFAAETKTGDEALDRALRIFTQPGYELQAQQLLSDPTIRQILLQLPFVDVVVEGGVVSLQDPFQELLTKLMGGPMGMMQLLTPQGIEKQVWMHDAVATLLVTIASKVG
jgi:hypothetical protein